MIKRRCDLVVSFLDDLVQREIIERKIPDRRNKIIQPEPAQKNSDFFANAVIQCF